MFTDINVSGDLNSKFHDFLKAENTDAGIGFSIHVSFLYFLPKIAIIVIIILIKTILRYYKQVLGP